MRHTALVALIAIVVFSMSGTSFAEEWKQFTSREDQFSANFPGEPVVTNTSWQSEYGAFLPAHVYTVKQGPATYSVTVVDYTLAKDLLIENAKRCPPALERCNGLTSYSGEGYWKNDVRGAMIYAEFKMLQRDVKVTHFMWNYLGGEGVESNEMQLLNNADKSRTFATLYMHRNRLYIMEATVPGNYPAPGLFTESISLREPNGNPTRHEGVYFNAARLDPYEINTGLTRILAAGGGAAEEDEGDPEWKRFTSREDQFSANFPGVPAITKMPWKSEYGAYLPAYVYTVKKGPASYSVTVVDYTLAKDLLIANAKRCPPALERCNGLTSYSGEGYWKNDVRGAMIYAEFKMLQRDVKVTHFMWNYLGGEGIESNEMQLLNNADKSRTFATFYMHNNKLYIMEATVPGNYPAPGLFTESISLLEPNGTRARHEGVYFNGARLDPYEINTGLTRILAGLGGEEARQPQDPPAPPRQRD